MIYKIFRTDEWQLLQDKGETLGAPVDLADGFIHFSTAAQAGETLAKHFAGEDGLILAAIDTGPIEGELKWEPSRGGQLFPHLYRALRLDEVAWTAPIARTDGGFDLPPLT